MPTTAHKKIWMLFSFALTVVITAGALKVASWIPTAVQTDKLRRYADIRDVKFSLGISHVYLPSYFPEYLGWPPAGIWAQKRPFEAVAMHFIRKEHDSTTLTVSQTKGRAGLSILEALKQTKVARTSVVSIKGRDAELSEGVCKDGKPCNKIEWAEGEFRLEITGRCPPQELVRIAESTHH